MAIQSHDFLLARTQRVLLPPTAPRHVSVQTPIGVAVGSMDVAGTSRFAVQYAMANRWEESTMATTWNLPSVTDILLSILDLIRATTPKIECSECGRVTSSLSPAGPGLIKLHRELSFDGIIRAAEHSKEFCDADVVRHISHTRTHGLIHTFSTTGFLAVHSLLVLLRTRGLTVPTWLLRHIQSLLWFNIALGL